MTEKYDAASTFGDTRRSGSIEISVPGGFTAVGFSGQQKNPGASAAERGRPSLFKTIDEDQRQRHDHINRSGRSTYLEEKSVQTSGATPRRSTGLTPIPGSRAAGRGAKAIAHMTCRLKDRSSNRSRRGSQRQSTSAPTSSCRRSARLTV